MSAKASRPWDALFFDFDGVLVESVEVKTQAFAEIFKQYGRDIQDRVVAHHRDNGGMTRREKFRHYYEFLLEKQLHDQELDQLCSRFAAIVFEKVIAAPEIPGAVDLLKECKKKVPCFVISGTPELELREIVERRGWTEYFVETCGAPDTKHDHLKRLLGNYALNPAHCIFFGDAFSDYQAASESRIPFIGILPNPEAPLLKAVPEIRWIRNFHDF